jgi:hypothetical protein
MIVDLIASEADAMDYVFGYMNFIDGSARGLGPPANVFFQMKSRDTFAPIGPYLVTADEIKDALKLQIRLWNNGVLMQDFNTDDMGHKIGSASPGCHRSIRCYPATSSPRAPITGASIHSWTAIRSSWKPKVSAG